MSSQTIRFNNIYGIIKVITPAELLTDLLNNTDPAELCEYECFKTFKLVTRGPLGDDMSNLKESRVIKNLIRHRQHDDSIIIKISIKGSTKTAYLMKS